MSVVREGATRMVKTGVTTINVFNGRTTQIAIPETAAPGDLMVLALIGGFAGDDFNKARCTDARMLPAVERTIDDGNYSLSLGQVGVDRTPIGIDFAVSTTGGIGHILGHGFLVTLRMAGATSVDVDPTRRAGVEWKQLDETTDRSLPDIPGLYDIGQAAMCVIATGQVGVGGVDVNYGLCFPPWTQSHSAGTYLEVAVLLTDSPSVRAALNPNINGNAHEWHAAVFGLIGTGIEDKVVTRQYPRDDGRGHSSAPRLYPPTKAQRIFGGYQ